MCWSTPDALWRSRLQEIAISHGYRSADAGAVADDDRGQDRPLAQKRGRAVQAGDVLAEIETDKATMEVEAVDEGVLAKIVIPEGTEHVAVNTPIARDRRKWRRRGAVDERRATTPNGPPAQAPARKRARRSTPPARAAPAGSATGVPSPNTPGTPGP